MGLNSEGWESVSDFKANILIKKNWQENFIMADHFLHMIDVTLII